MKKTINGNIVTFTFDDNVPAYVIDCDKLAPEIKAHAIPFAMCHRLGDAAAIQKSADNGYKVTEAMRRVEVAALGDYYQGGATDWNVRVASGPRKPAINPIWAKLAEARGVEYSVIAGEKAEADIAELMAMTQMVAPRG